MDFYEITVNGVTWEISDRTFMAEGADAFAYTSFTYSDLVLLIIPHKRQYKYDWLSFLDLIYGDSDYEDQYVLVVPLLEHISEPDWYDLLWQNLDREKTRDGYKKLKELKSEYPDDPSLQYWIDKLISFLDKYPKYLSSSYSFDLHSGNVMAYNGEPIIYDPFVGKR